jgi:uncharacterized protein (DUF2062 family)/trans-aconitate methyltransferase
MLSDARRNGQGFMKKLFVRKGLRSFLTLLLTEGVDPGRAAAAVFIGVFIAIVPVYGFQSLIAIGLATLFRLNKPLTFGATFVNNPLLQPFLVLFSLETGHYILKGEAWTIPAGGMTPSVLKSQLFAWFTGSLVLGAFLGGMAATAVFLYLNRRSAADIQQKMRRRARRRFIKSLFRESPAYARGFVRWKIRLDRIFDILAAEDLGEGPAVDLGCGYGMALGLASFQQPGRRLIGCDLDKQRVKTAGDALRPLLAELSVCDIRTFPLPQAGLIMIIDVLQYLDAAEQEDLLTKCCATLLPGGRLIFRVHDRRRSIASIMSLMLDKIIFRLSANTRRPLTLLEDDYRRTLENSGMKVTMRRFVNRLPLAHILFLSEKPVDDRQEVLSQELGAAAPVGT